MPGPKQVIDQTGLCTNGEGYLFGLLFSISFPCVALLSFCGGLVFLGVALLSLCVALCSSTRGVPAGLHARSDLLPCMPDQADIVKS